MPRVQPPAVHRFAHEAMATTFEVLVAGKEESYARQAAPVGNQPKPPNFKPPAVWGQ